MKRKDYSEDFYNMNTQDQVGVHMFDFEYVQRSKYFEGESIRGNGVESKVRQLQNGKVLQ